MCAYNAFVLVIQSRTIKFSNLLQKLYMNLFWNKISFISFFTERKWFSFSNQLINKKTYDVESMTSEPKHQFKSKMNMRAIYQFSYSMLCFWNISSIWKSVFHFRFFLKNKNPLKWNNCKRNDLEKFEFWQIVDSHQSRGGLFFKNFRNFFWPFTMCYQSHKRKFHFFQFCYFL